MKPSVHAETCSLAEETCNFQVLLLNQLENQNLTDICPTEAICFLFVCFVLFGGNTQLCSGLIPSSACT